MKYAELDLHESLKNNIAELGYESPTPIQEMVIPHAIKGKDISGLAQTGTGKTAAFLIPLINRILHSRDDKELETPELKFKEWGEKSFCLVLVPTRELAIQVANQATALSKNQDFNIVTTVGGEDIERQVKQINGGVLDILIATPGRLIDLYKNHHIDLKQVSAVVFDEADRMFDMGFKDDMRYILRRLPDERQYLLFSATMNLDVLTVSYQFGAEPVECHLKSEKLKADNVTDEIFHCGQKEKPKFLLSLIKKHEPNQLIIFTNLKRLVVPITEFLQKNGYDALGISSLLNQRQRNRVLEHFKTEGKANILVATDVAARGLDILGVDLVVNYDLPDDAENYVHRIGRTGRAGQEGVAFSLCSDRDVESLARIQDYVGHKLAIGWIEDSELVEEFKEFKITPSDKFLSDRKKAVGRQKNEGRNKNRKSGPSRGKPRHGDSKRKDYRSKDKDKDYDRDAKPYDKVKGAKASSKKKTKNKPKRKKVGSSKRKSKRSKAASKNSKPAAKPGIAKKITSAFKKLFG